MHVSNCSPRFARNVIDGAIMIEVNTVKIIIGQFHNFSNPRATGRITEQGKGILLNGGEPVLHVLKRDGDVLFVGPHASGRIRLRGGKGYLRLRERDISIRTEQTK